MKKSVFGLVAVLLMGMLAGGVVLGQGVRAQTYPPPVGSLSVEAGSTTPGSTTTVTATVLDNDGNPVEGAEVIFQIISQPGSDAAWANGTLETSGITDANGIASAILSAGAQTGNIMIETVSGEMTSQVTVGVQETGLPTSGGAPPEGPENGLRTWQIALLAAGAAALAGGFAIMVRRRTGA